ncbi:hypothetical protein FNF27_05551 [Cafeteria roenbergensis]|uniref:EGF-like domain-containing protein n=1 Tax=Cafeteria roenbergensis TaxID=33653 RepID=A0A5A8E722_CAFRO|nr:hypothetical protein FNF27_05551 [Cafeteria roenbergensis]
MPLGPGPAPAGAATCPVACGDHGFCGGQGKCVCMPWWSGDGCEVSFSGAVGEWQLDAIMWTAAAIHGIAILMPKPMGGTCCKPSGLASFDVPEGVCRCCWIPLDCRGCCHGRERAVAAGVLAVASTVRVAWIAERRGVGVMDDFAFLVVDVMLLRVPQCLWAWAFMLMAVVWKDIAAAASGGSATERFRCGMNALGATLTATVLTVTLVGAPLLSTDEALGLVMYHVGDGALALVIGVLVVGGMVTVWRVLGVLHRYRAQLIAEAPGGFEHGRLCCSCAPRTCAALCTPIRIGGGSHGAATVEGAEAATFAAVYEALRQTTIGMFGGIVLSIALIVAVGLEAGLPLSTNKTPVGYAVYLAVYLACECAGSALLAFMTWPRTAASPSPRSTPGPDSDEDRSYLREGSEVDSLNW